MHHKGVALVDGADGLVARLGVVDGYEHFVVDVRDLIDEIGLDAVAAVGKNREGRGHFPGRGRARPERRGELRGRAGRIKAEFFDVFLRVARADGLHDADRDEVLGLAQGHGQAHRAVELVVVVARLPEFSPGQTRIDEDRRVVDDRARVKALVEGRRVDEGLKGRAGLAQRLRDVVEHVEVKVKAAHQALDRPRIEVHADEAGLHLGNLRQGPAVLDARDADDAARLQTLALGGLGREIAAGKLAAGRIQADRRQVLVAGDDRLKGFIGEFRDDRGLEIVRRGGLIEGQTNVVVAAGRVRNVDVAARAAVAVFAVIVDEVTAHRRPGRALILVADGGVHVQAARVGFVAEDVVDEHARHFGGVLGVNVFAGFFLRQIHGVLGRHQRRIDLFAVGDVVDVLQLVHAA